MKDKEYNSIIDAIEAKIDKFFEMHEDKSPAPGLYARACRGGREGSD